jgi:hypothetical protein
VRSVLFCWGVLGLWGCIETTDDTTSGSLGRVMLYSVEGWWFVFDTTSSCVQLACHIQKRMTAAF